MEPRLSAQHLLRVVLSCDQCYIIESMTPNKYVENEIPTFSGLSSLTQCLISIINNLLWCKVLYVVQYYNIAVFISMIHMGSLTQIYVCVNQPSTNKNLHNADLKCYWLQKFIEESIKRQYKTENLQIRYIFSNIINYIMNTTCKRKRVVLNLKQKLEICKKVEDGASHSAIIDEYGIGKSTLKDILSNKTKLRDFCTISEDRDIARRHTMRGASLKELDTTLHSWFIEKRAQGMPVTGPLLIEKAKSIHKDLQLDQPLNFSNGWLHRFKRRHGIRQMKLSGESFSADHEAAQTFLHTFTKMLQDHALTPEQVSITAALSLLV